MGAIFSSLQRDKYCLCNTEFTFNEKGAVEMYADPEALIDGFKKGDIRALARSITLVENDSPRAIEILSSLYAQVGRAYRIGITGPPGAGKSTLVNRLALALRKEEHSVGILAVDPSSPFTGGALLGDRIRMSDSLQDKNVFMRSMATRGSLGGLARTTTQAADLLDAFGHQYILIETVGVGQIELDVAMAVDTTVVVLVPEGGGSIQAMKAGIMEIANILVINKADRPGAEELEDEIRQILELRGERERKTPLLRVAARSGMGMNEFLASIECHKKFMEEKGGREEKRRGQIRNAILSRVFDRVQWLLSEKRELQDMLTTLSDEVFNRRCDPFSAAAAIEKALGLL